MIFRWFFVESGRIRRLWGGKRWRDRVITTALSGMMLFLLAGTLAWADPNDPVSGKFYDGDRRPNVTGDSSNFGLDHTFSRTRLSELSNYSRVYVIYGLMHTEQRNIPCVWWNWAGIAGATYLDNRNVRIWYGSSFIKYRRDTETYLPEHDCITDVLTENNLHSVLIFKMFDIVFMVSFENGFYDRDQFDKNCFRKKVYSFVQGTLARKSVSSQFFQAVTCVSVHPEAGNSPNDIFSDSDLTDVSSFLAFH